MKLFLSPLYCKKIGKLLILLSILSLLLSAFQPFTIFILPIGGAGLFKNLYILIPFLLLLSGAYYIKYAYLIQKEFITIVSIILQTVGIFLYIIQILVGVIPCVFGPHDGFCMLIGIPVGIASSLTWSTGLILFLLGQPVYLLQKNKSKKNT